MPRAAPEYIPQKVKITNLTENSFVVSWVTEEPTIGFIKFGETAVALSVTAIDDRDQLTGASGEYRTHYISIQNLKPTTKYYFKLGSEKNQLYDDNGKAFELTTPTPAGNPPPADTAYGTVITSANTPAEGAIVYLSLENATPISALVKQNGNWAANLSTARTSTLSQYASYDAKTARIDILVQPGTGDPAKVVALMANHQPIPTITLGQTQDFTNDNTSALASPTPDPTPEGAPTPLPQSKFSLNPLEASQSNDPSISISTFPREDTIITTPKPEITGNAPAGTVLTITVHSPTALTGQTQTDSTGNWTWTPPINLESGDHTITVSYTDESGILHKMTRHFSVNSSDLNALDFNTPGYSATPSASATPRPTPTPTPTPKPSIMPSPTPRTTVATESANVVAGTTTPTLMLLLFGTFITITGLVTLRRKSI